MLAGIADTRTTTITNEHIGMHIGTVSTTARDHIIMIAGIWLAFFQECQR